MVREAERYVVPLVGVKRTVVHEGKHLGGPGHLELPRLHLAGVELFCQMLGLDVEVFVVPRHPHCRGIVVDAVLADECRLDLKLAAMLVRNRKLAEPQRAIARDIFVENGLAVACHLDAAPAPLVARPPVDAHRPADLDVVRLDAEELRHCDAKSIRMRIEHAERVDAFHRLAVLVLRFEDEPVRADAKLQFSRPFLRRFRRNRPTVLFCVYREDLLARFPRLPVPRALRVSVAGIAPLAGRLADRTGGSLEPKCPQRPPDWNVRSRKRP